MPDRRDLFSLFRPGGMAAPAERRSRGGGAADAVPGPGPEGGFELEGGLDDLLSLDAQERPEPGLDVRGAAYQEIKAGAHRRLLEKLNLESVAALDRRWS